MATGCARVLGGVVALALATSGCGGGSGGNGTPEQPAPTTITVNGTVNRQRSVAAAVEPDVGVSVAIEGHATVVTDGAGRFTVPDVEPPYDVVVFDATKGDLALVLGLTRADPVLAGTRPENSGLHSTWTAGSVTGGVGWPPPAAHETIVSFAIPGRMPTGHVVPEEADGSYAYSLQGSGSTTVPVTGAALQ